MSVVIGIDLGTTYSSAAAIREDAVFVVENENGRRTFPSVIHFDERGRATVGDEAVARSIDDPANTIHSAKRLLGSRFDDPVVKIAQSAYLYKISRGPNDWPLIEARGGPHAIPSLCASILKEIKKRAEIFFGDSIEKAVITVPANANDSQREQTRVAGRIAGLEVIGLVNEPTAAATAYSLLQIGGRTMAVYDFGGGTFDCSIIDWNDVSPKVLATHGDSFLGGDDIDLALAMHVAQDFQRKAGIDIRQRASDWRQLMLSCEGAKRRLSHGSQASFVLPKVGHTQEGPIDLNVELDRQTLQRLANPLILQSVDIMKEALGMAGLSTTDLDQVLLVGGSSRLPLVRKIVRKSFGKLPLVDIDPELAVAIGAAVEAQRLIGGDELEARPSAAVIEVVPSSFGLATAGGGFDPVIRRNTTLPAEGQRTYTTWRDGQREMRFVVLQGDNERAEGNTRLGEFVVDDIPPRPSGEIEIQLIFEVGLDGLLRVTARNTTTGKTHRLGVRVHDV